MSCWQNSRALNNTLFLFYYIYFIIYKNIIIIYINK